MAQPSSHTDMDTTSDAGKHEAVRQFILAIHELAKENMKGQDGYEMIAEWAGKALHEMGEEI